MSALKKNRLADVLQKSPEVMHKPNDDWPLAMQLIGIEIEVENSPSAQADALMKRGWWTIHHDESLRGGIEFVFAKPLLGQQLTDAIDAFYDTVIKFTASPRTSIHVHMDMISTEDDNPQTLRHLITLYYMLEDAVFSVADTNRKWTTYCCTFDDKHIQWMRELFAANVRPTAWRSMFQNLNETDRYYGLNLGSLYKYGTVEFRHLPCVTDRKRLKQWLIMLMEMKAAAIELMRMDDINYAWDVFTDGQTIVDFLAKTMPQSVDLLLSYVTAEELYDRMLSLLATMTGIKYTEDHIQLVADNPVLNRYMRKRFPDGSNRPVAREDQVLADPFSTPTAGRTSRPNRQVQISRVTPQSPTTGASWEDLSLDEFRGLTPEAPSTQEQMMRLQEHMRSLSRRLGTAAPSVEVEGPRPRTGRTTRSRSTGV